MTNEKWIKPSLTAAVLCLVVLTAAACTADTTATDAPDPAKTHTLEGSIRFYDTLDECISQADIILTCTVAEVGETYLYGNPTLPFGIHESSWPSIARDFRTPVTLSVDEVLLDKTGAVADTLTITEYRGTYDGYTALSQFPEYEPGREYLLCIAVAPDGETNIVMHQGSVDITDGFVPLFNEWIFEGLSSVADVKAVMENLE